jgi:predicted ATP-dependent protease
MAGEVRESTADISIPKDPFERIIGQDEAVRIARLAPIQRRHLLLAGAPGTGKSLIAQAIASVLPKPKFEVAVLDNSERHERPIIEIYEGHAKQIKGSDEHMGEVVASQDVPVFVAEALGLRCRRCGTLLSGVGATCATCSSSAIYEVKRRIATSEKEKNIIYSLYGRSEVLVQSEGDIKRQEELAKKNKKKILLPLERKNFVTASGASETELLGDVSHDPYGDSGTPAYLRVMPGAIHESHEGVLFIDELSTLGDTQRHLLTAMQEKCFSITGRNPTSSGAAVRVDYVPTDFIFVGASNINDLQSLLPALRSRISGDGYEVLMNSTMPDNEDNRKKIQQFIAQEIQKDGRIPHAGADAIDALIIKSRKIAKETDEAANSLSLRLRNLSGIIKLAGDLAKFEKQEYISKDNVTEAIEQAKSIEEKLADRYGSSWRANAADYSIKINKENKDIR